MTNTSLDGLRKGGLIFFLTTLSLGAQQFKPAAQVASAPRAAGASPARASASPDKVVMKVGDEKITAAQIQMLVKSSPPQILRTVTAQEPSSTGEQYALMLALSQRAIRDHLDQDPEINLLMKMQEQQMLAQAEYKKLVNDVKVTSEDVSQYFAVHKSDFDRADVRQVTVRKKPTGAKPDIPGLSEKEARLKAEEIRKALVGGADATKLAENYKTELSVVYIEITPRDVRRASLQGDVQKQIFDLKDGKNSEIMENAQSVYFTQMVKHHNGQLNDVAREIESKLHKERLQAAIDNIKNSSNIWLDPDFFAAPAVPATLPAARPNGTPPTN